MSFNSKSYPATTPLGIRSLEGFIGRPFISPNKASFGDGLLRLGVLNRDAAILFKADKSITKFLHATDVVRAYISLNNLINNYKKL